MVKVSVIVPVYNTSKYLDICLTSILKQSLQDIEIIAIDDASTDQSFQILKKYADENSNIRLYHNDQNRGPGFTRNLGIKLARGEYIGFVDSDDYIHPKMYETMYQGALMNHYPEMIVTNMIFVKSDEYAKNDLSYMNRSLGTIINPILEKNKMLDISPSVCLKLFRRDFIKHKYFLEDCLWEDIAFSNICFMEAKRILLYSNVDYFYRRDLSSGISSINYHPNDKILDVFKVNDEIEKRALLDNYFLIFNTQIRTIQYFNILQRISEINTWNIKEEEKKNLNEKILSLTIQKYGEINCDSLLLLQTKMPTDFLENRKYLK